MLVRFKKTNRIRVILFQCSNFEVDGSFLTRTILFKSNSDFYSVEKISENIFKIKPKVSYEIYSQTKDHNEANLLKISYYAGSDIKDIIKAIDSKTFIVDDKVPVEYRVPTEKYPNGGEETAKGRVNDILKYKGLDHVDKPLDMIRYEGDMYTKIELLDDCRFELYKFKIKVFKI